MEEKPKSPATVDEYIAQFPSEIQATLSQIRAVVKAAAPDATEKIGYGMPSYYLNGYLLGFAAFKRHIGLYPTPEGIEAFRDELAPYLSSKGGVQFPLDKPFPYDLLDHMVRLRVEEKRKK